MEPKKQKRGADVKAKRDCGELCVVCGDNASGFHCGAFICEACKKFFIRAATKDIELQRCGKGGGCLITKESRTHCQACRLSKCRHFGLSPDKDPVVVGSLIAVIPCRVCGAPSSGYHFGAITCEGCKGFFRRMSMVSDHEKTSQCLKYATCDVTAITRNACKICRYQKCVDVGMSLLGSRIGRRTNADKHTTLKEIKKTQVYDRAMTFDPSPSISESRSYPDIITVDDSESNRRSFDCENSLNNRAVDVNVKDQPYSIRLKQHFVHLDETKSETERKQFLMENLRDDSVTSRNLHAQFRLQNDLHKPKWAYNVMNKQAASSSVTSNFVENSVPYHTHHSNKSQKYLFNKFHKKNIHRLQTSHSSISGKFDMTPRDMNITMTDVTSNLPHDFTILNLDSQHTHCTNAQPHDLTNPYRDGQHTHCTNTQPHDLTNPYRDGQHTHCTNAQPHDLTNQHRDGQHTHCTNTQPHDLTNQHHDGQHTHCTNTQPHDLTNPHRDGQHTHCTNAQPHDLVHSGNLDESKRDDCVNEEIDGDRLVVAHGDTCDSVQIDKLLEFLEEIEAAGRHLVAMSERAPNKQSFHEDDTVQIMLQKTMAQFNAFALACVAFLKNVSRISQLNTSDRIILVQRGLHSITILNSCRRSDISTLTLFNYTHDELDMCIRKVPSVQELANGYYSMYDCVMWLKLDTTEFAALSVLAFTASAYECDDLQESDSVMKICDDVCHALYHYEQKVYPDQPSRYGIILLRVSHFSSLNRDHDKWLANLFTSNPRLSVGAAGALFKEVFKV